MENYLQFTAVTASINIPRKGTLASDWSNTSTPAFNQLPPHHPNLFGYGEIIKCQWLTNVTKYVSDRHCQFLHLVSLHWAEVSDIVYTVECKCVRITC